MKNIDFANGKILKPILLFWLPILLGMVLQQCYGLIDAIIVGQTIDSNAYVSIGVTSSLVFLILGFANGLLPV